MASVSAPSPISSAGGNGLALTGWAIAHAAHSQAVSDSPGLTLRRTIT